MAPLKIEVTGNHSVTLAAELAILRLHISSTGPSQSQVSSTVTTTSNQLQTLLKSLSSEFTVSWDDSLTRDPPITKWTMSSLNTGSWFAYSQSAELPQRTYTASTDFEVTFQDFKQLGAVTMEMAEMTGVEVRSVQWALTEETKARHAKVARQGAVKDAIDKARDYAMAAGKVTVNMLELTECPVAKLFGTTSPGSFGSGGILTRGGGATQEQRLSFEPGNRDVGCQVKVVFEAV